MNTQDKQGKEKKEGDLTHELRTSLSIIKVNSEVALLDENLDPKEKKRLESNVKEVDRIVGMLGQLLGPHDK
ncbi:MAG: histidine kinase dimerization/phospho-acceptor domain-containing protein [Parcubacteria group bacterium]